MCTLPAQRRACCFYRTPHTLHRCLIDDSRNMQLAVTLSGMGNIWAHGLNLAGHPSWPFAILQQFATLELERLHTYNCHDPGSMSS